MVTTVHAINLANPGMLAPDVASAAQRKKGKSPLLRITVASFEPDAAIIIFDLDKHTRQFSSWYPPDPLQLARDCLIFSHFFPKFWWSHSSGGRKAVNDLTFEATYEAIGEATGGFLVTFWICMAGVYSVDGPTAPQ